MKRIFLLNMKCSGEVPKGVNPKGLFFELDLDGKIKVWTDSTRTKRVRIRIGSTAVTQIRFF